MIVNVFSYIDQILNIKKIWTQNTVKVKNIAFLYNYKGVYKD